MKKILCLLVCMLMSGNALAETIIVVDDNGYVKSTQQINTPTTVVSTPVTVVRETPVNNTYYYDRSATNTAVAAGITTAVVGTLLFEGIAHHHHHKHHHAPAPRPVHRHHHR